MNSGITFLSALAMAIALSFVPSSCTANRTKPAVLFPPAQLTWPAVQEDLQRGIADGVEKGDLPSEASNTLLAECQQLGAALNARDLEAVRQAPWSLLEPWADRGIADKLADGEIGPGVAVSLREQLGNFTNTITNLQGTY
jgi:hypothetical protein